MCTSSLLAARVIARLVRACAPIARGPTRASTHRHGCRVRSTDAGVHDLSCAEDDGDAPYVIMRRVRNADVGSLSDVLLSLGASSVSTIDADRGSDAEEEIFSANTFVEESRAEEKTRLWKSCNLAAYFDSHDVARDVIASAEDILGLKLDVEYATAKANDWVEVVKDSFTPTKISEGLFIVPSWCEDVDTSAVNIALEPGIAFGTGEHPTTRLCLRWLENVLRKEPVDVVVDFGCGSGVLAIGALLLGAKNAVGVDLAKQAVVSSMDNAKLNGVEDRLTVFCGDGTDVNTPGANGQADIVVANILIEPVLGLEELFAGYVKPGGRIALSGILYGEQSEKVVALYTKHFDDIVVDHEGGWACVSGTRNAVDVVL